MEFLKNKTVKNICINCVFTVVACVVLYLISYFCFGKIEIGTDNLIGILAVLSTILIISSFWLWSYWNLDTVQHEPIQMMIYSFITSFMMQFLLSSMVNQITAYIIPNSVNLILQKYIYNVLLPVCTMYSVFYMYIVHLNAFDEAVDCLIYGGFIGEYVEQGDTAEDVDNAIFSQPTTGGISDVVESKFGYHIFMVDSITPAERVPLEDVRAQIEQIMIIDRQNEAIDAETKRVAKKYQIKIK